MRGKQASTTDAPRPPPEPTVTPLTPAPSAAPAAPSALEALPAFGTFRLGLGPDEEEHAGAEPAALDDDVGEHPDDPMEEDPIEDEKPKEPEPAPTLPPAPPSGRGRLASSSRMRTSQVRGLRRSLQPPQASVSVQRPLLRPTQSRSPGLRPLRRRLARGELLSTRAADLPWHTIHLASIY